MPSDTAVGRNTGWEAPARADLEIEVTTLPPVFVVGQRVDRGRLAVLLDGRGISFAPESSLLTDLAAAARRNWPELCRYGYPKQYWLRRVAVFFDSLQSEYAASRGLSRWGAMAEPGDLALVDRLFPRCQVVWVLPDRRWTRSARAAGIRPGRYYELTADSLVLRPDAAVAGVLSFLDPLVEVPSRP